MGIQNKVFALIGNKDMFQHMNFGEEKKEKGNKDMIMKLGRSRARWQNRTLQHFYPCRNVNVNNYPCMRLMKIPSQWLRISDERFCAARCSTEIRNNTLKKTGGTVLHYLCQPSPNPRQYSVEKDIICLGKGEGCEY